MAGYWVGRHDPDLEGVDHVNVYSKSRLELGRLLSNFAHTPFELDGVRFASVEAAWYAWSVPADHPRLPELRAAHGWEAKRLGRELRGADWPSGDGHTRFVLACLQAKLDQTPRIRGLLATTGIKPLVHYYVGKDGTTLEPKDGLWMLDFWSAEWRAARKEERSGAAR